MSKNRPSVHSVKCPDCQAEITRFRTRHIPYYDLVCICPSCGKGFRASAGQPPEAPKIDKVEKLIQEASKRPINGFNQAGPIPAPLSPQMTLQGTLADPKEMAQHIKAKAEEPGPDHPDLPAPEVLPTGPDPTKAPEDMEQMLKTALAPLKGAPQGIAEQVLSKLSPEDRKLARKLLDLPPEAELQ